MSFDVIFLGCVYFISAKEQRVEDFSFSSASPAALAAHDSRGYVVFNGTIINILLQWPAVD